MKVVSNNTREKSFFISVLFSCDTKLRDETFPANGLGERSMKLPVDAADFGIGDFDTIVVELKGIGRFLYGILLCFFG